VDGCRIDAIRLAQTYSQPDIRGNAYNAERDKRHMAEVAENLGRWPANLIHDGSDEVLACFPLAPGQLADASSTAPSSRTKNCFGKMSREGEASADRRYTEEGSTNFAALPGQRRLDSGSAARFFYCAKTSKSERGEGNNHPTVKPQALMRYLCRLVTPPGGIVLDPFCGSGSTGLAALAEGFRFVGIEQKEEYCRIAADRLTAKEVVNVG
jgi:site-specific DNA-methyltransferase (adenine-specific)